jgi:hypothetical protein
MTHVIKLLSFMVKLEHTLLSIIKAASAAHSKACGTARGRTRIRTAQPHARQDVSDSTQKTSLRHRRKQARLERPPACTDKREARLQHIRILPLHSSVTKSGNSGAQQGAWKDTTR